MQSSSQRYSSVVFRGEYIQALEIYWFLPVDTWKTCVALGLCHVTILDHLVHSRFREKCALVRPSSKLYLCETDCHQLSSSVVQDIKALHEAGRALMAYFYFDFRDVDKQGLHNLLPSLLIQLSAQSDPCCDVLSQLYSAHDRGIQKPSDLAMVECLHKMFTLEAQLPTYIIIDALDECPVTSTVPSPREEVLELVEELVGLHLPSLHICVTSRPESDILLS